MSWASIIEPKTLEQAKRTASMPFVFPHVALMPDAHLGMGATVGSVIATQGAIMPAAVGVDIGCGMIAVRTQFTKDQLPTDLRALRESIESAIPLSPGVYNDELTDSAAARTDILAASWHRTHPKEPDGPAQTPNWKLQLGSLGGGNHFIEVSADEEGRVWFFLHSGSRGVGNRIAKKHIAVAQAVMKQFFITLPDPDLAYLVQGTPEFTSYLNELRWGQEFALANRAEMMDRVIAQFEAWSGLSVEETERIQCHHNYTVNERHFGRDIWVSRKGAIDAHEGVPGLIPGSMGTASYVVVGLGNHKALHSAPHGAGRNFSRRTARQKFTQDDLRNSMAGIEFRDSDAFVDEIPAAYKPIEVVMDDAADLVTVRHTLHQLVNVKGE